MYIHIPFSWFVAASRLPGKTAIVASLLYLQANLQRSDLWHNDRKGLPTRLLEECGLDRHTLYRALHALEAAGLIQVHRKRGSKPVITIIELNGSESGREAEGEITSKQGTSIFDDIAALRSSNLAAMPAMQAKNRGMADRVKRSPRK
jgi:hypothetical protein